MYEKNLKLIFDQYISRFDELNDPNGNDEGYKWRAETSFKKYWDIDAKDFLSMFKNAFKDLSNLIDNKTVQPLGGITMLLNFPEETEYVRASFRELFSEDYGDIDARQERIYDFMNKINPRIEKYAKGSWKYPQQLNNVIYYLNLWRPNENYIYKATEATDWANCIEFGDDIGSGNSFSLKKYYRMCDELLEAVSKNEQIMKLHKQRFEQTAKGYDDKMHILVYDIIYCAKHYGFHSNALAATTSTKTRLENIRLRNEFKKQKEQIADFKRQKDKILISLNKSIDLTGLNVYHKTWKMGTIIGANEKTVKIEFNGEIKRLQYPSAFTDGFLTLEDGDIIKKIEDEINLKTELKKLDKKIKDADENYQKLTISLDSRGLL